MHGMLTMVGLPVPGVRRCAVALLTSLPAAWILLKLPRRGHSLLPTTAELHALVDDGAA